MIVGVAAGLIRIMYLKSSNVADIIPADIVINTVLVAGYRTNLKQIPSLGSEHTETKPVTIYNCISGNENPINYGMYYSVK